MDLMLQDKVAVITAASQGLGYATAKALAAEGAHIIICSRSQEAVDQAALRIAAELAELRPAAPSVDILPVAADVTRSAAIDHLRTVVLDRFGRVDALFINAGGPPTGYFVDLKPADWAAASQLTIQSAIELAYAFVPTMREQQSGSILANTSVTVRHPLDGLTLSNSLRMAVVGLVKSLSIELGPDNIRVNAIAPGWTRTSRVDNILNARAKEHQSTPEQEAEKIAASVPLRRVADPEEYARVATFLLSPAASYVTGVTLQVDGGMARSVL